MEIDPLSGGSGSSSTEQVASPGKKRLSCEFCECQLTASGEVFRMSEKARSLRDLEEKMSSLQKEIAAERERSIALERDARKLQEEMSSSLAGKKSAGLSF